MKVKDIIKKLEFDGCSFLLVNNITHVAITLFNSFTQKVDDTYGNLIVMEYEFDADIKCVKLFCVAPYDVNEITELKLFKEFLLHYETRSSYYHILDRAGNSLYKGDDFNELLKFENYYVWNYNTMVTAALNTVTLIDGDQGGEF